MNIYKIKRLDAINYDEYDSFVICAENPLQARNFAAAEANYGEEPEGDSMWLNPEITSVEIIGIASIKAGVVIGSYNAG